MRFCYKKNIIVLSLFFSMILIPSFLSADGVGGVYWGFQQIAYPWESENDPVFSSSNDQLACVGGMGYGIDENGHVAGGFGVGFSEQGEEEGLSAGFGGIISGYRFIKRPLNLLGLIYAGVGGVSDASAKEPGMREGSFALMGEATLEASLPLVFFHPTLYVGYQAIASVDSEGLGESFFSYSPTIGVRLLWGAQ